MNDHHPPPTCIGPQPPGRIPSEDQCRAWWDNHGMLPHIKEHSLLVAGVATTLAELAAARGLGIPEGLTAAEFVRSVRAAGLLHDLGKTYSIHHGGNHSQIGAAWTLELTGNPRIAQGVMHHVHWPGALDLGRHFLPLAIIYGDKRVKHDTIVDIDERFADLFERESPRIKEGEVVRGRVLSVDADHVQGVVISEGLLLGDKEVADQAGDPSHEVAAEGTAFTVHAIVVGHSSSQIVCDTHHTDVVGRSGAGIGRGDVERTDVVGHR